MPNPTKEEVEAMAKRLGNANWTPGKTVSDDITRWQNERNEAAAMLRSLQEERERLECDYEEAIEEARNEGIDEGRTEAQGATDQFWRMMQSYLQKEGIEPTPESGEGITAQEMMDAVHELISYVRQEARRTALEPRNERA